MFGSHSLSSHHPSSLLSSFRLPLQLESSSDMAIEDPTNISHLSYNQYQARDLTVSVSHSTHPPISSLRAEMSFQIPRFGRPVEIKGPSRPVRSIAYSCDGKRVATGMEYKGIRVWDARKTVSLPLLGHSLFCSPQRLSLFLRLPLTPIFAYLYL